MMSDLPQGPGSSLATPDSAPRPPSQVVAIGASAGGLAALEDFFDHMPPDSGMAFVIIQHLSPDFKSLMDDLLARHTRMNIHRVTEGMRLEADSIYLIPPKTVMTVADGRLRLRAVAGGQHNELPIDAFFRSLAEDAGAKAIAVVLSGTGTDGSRGIAPVSQAGGLVLVQSFESAQFDGMPRSAFATGLCHLMLNPEQMPLAIMAYLQTPEGERSEFFQQWQQDEEHGEFHQIFAILRSHYHLDFSKYKPPTVGRRIQRRMEFMRLDNPASYAALLATNNEELEALYRDLLIGVTEFFRDIKVFRRLEQTVLPELFRNRKVEEEVRVWSAGCATGEEPYSLAILLAEQAARTNFQGTMTVFATDVHRASLDLASQGVFDKARLKNVSPERLERYFIPESGDRYRISPAIRKMIVFAPHNLIGDPPFTRMDLICCRNLLIYLQPEIQDKVLALFHFALRRNGVLFLGSSEGLGKLAGEFETLDHSCKLYRKVRDLRIALDMKMEPVAPRFSVSGIRPHPHRLTVSLDRQLVTDYDRLLELYMPAGVLIDENRHILHCFGDVSNLVQQPQGRFENDLLALVAEDFKIPLSTALHRAGRTQSRVTVPNIAIRRGEACQKRDLLVEYLQDAKSPAGHFFVTIQPVPVGVPEPQTEQACQIDSNQVPVQLHSRIGDLEQELQVTKENLQATIEELQTTNEELQTTNEELMAANEELQSTNEELHSVNEELYTVNAEFELKNKELKHLNQDHENLLGSTDVGTVYLDKYLRIRKFNAAIEKIFKLLPQDIGRPIDHIACHLNHQDEMLQNIRRVLESGQVEEREVLTQEGQCLLQRLLPFRTEAGKVEGVVLTFTDITRIKETERALAEANERLEGEVVQRTAQLQEAKAAADRANAAKSLFLANMSHEIRTPMTGIFGTIQLLENSELSPRQQECLRTLRISAGNLMEILDDILDFSKIEAGKMILNPEGFCLATLIEELRQLHRPRLEVKGLDLELELADGLPAALVGDVLRLKQVLSNLLANAIKFTDRGKVGLLVQQVGGAEEQLQLQFTVWDTGIGLAPEVFKLIFEPFTQADSSITRRYGGTGLGLAICKKLVTLMGGRIWADNRPDGGAAFHFTVLLKVPQSRHPEILRGGITENAAMLRGQSGLKVLVAEDDALNREMIVAILQHLGCVTVAAQNGAEAIELLAREPIDMVLMDVSMPEMDGVSATRHIRSLPETVPRRQVPIIALTAHALEENRRQFMAAGFNEVLTKPFTIEALKKALHRCRRQSEEGISSAPPA